MMINNNSLKIALVYDRINTLYGGAESVLTALHQAFPSAPVFTSVYHSQAHWAKSFIIKTSFLQKLPLANIFHRYFSPLMPLAFESFDFSKFNIIISISSAEAKGIITKPHQLHICYLLTPTRYLYSHKKNYQETHWPFKLPLIKNFSKLLFDYLTWWDQTAAFRPDAIIPISNLVKTRTQQYYKRTTQTVIYPPFNANYLALVDNYQTATQTSIVDYPNDYYLVISRLVPYKKIELAIKACEQLNRKLVIIGVGPALKRLQKIGKQNVVFLHNISQLHKQNLILKAKALIMPAVEDFGITALEAAVAGLPVILHQQSGVTELLKNQTGIYTINRATVSKIKKAMIKVELAPDAKPQCKIKLTKYAINNFIDQFRDCVYNLWSLQQKGKL